MGVIFYQMLFGRRPFGEGMVSGMQCLPALFLSLPPASPPAANFLPNPAPNLAQTQQRILTSQSILRATSVAFPQKPAVSDEAKAFIKKCLTHNQHLRPDVLAMAKDPYVILGGKGGRRR